MSHSPCVYFLANVTKILYESKCEIIVCSKGIPHTAPSRVPANMTPRNSTQQKQVLPSTVHAPTSQQKSLHWLPIRWTMSKLKMQGATKMNVISSKRVLFGLSITVKGRGMPSIMRHNAAITRPSEVKKNSHVKTRGKGGCWIWIKHRLAYISRRVDWFNTCKNSCGGQPPSVALRYDTASAVL